MELEIRSSFRHFSAVFSHKAGFVPAEIARSSPSSGKSETLLAVTIQLGASSDSERVFAVITAALFPQGERAILQVKYSVDPRLRPVEMRRGDDFLGSFRQMFQKGVATGGIELSKNVVQKQ